MPSRRVQQLRAESPPVATRARFALESDALTTTFAALQAAHAELARQLAALEAVLGVSPRETKPTAVMPAGMTCYISAQSIAASMHCSKTAAYRYLREAGGRNGRVALGAWEAYAARRFCTPSSGSGRRLTPAPAEVDPTMPAPIPPPTSTTASATTGGTRRGHQNPLLPPLPTRRAIRIVLPRRRR